MSKFFSGFRRLIVRQEGQGMTEYGLIIALIAVILISSLTALGKGLQTKFKNVNDAIAGAKVGGK